MFKLTSIILLCLLGLPAAHLSDESLSRESVLLQNLSRENRYNPVINNIYHLFTRENPSVSQPMVMYNEAMVINSNYNNNRRTIVLIHGFGDNVISNFNAVLVPAFLAAEDLNVIVVDWSAGASGLYTAAVANTVTSGNGVAQFIDWLNALTGTMPVQYHIVGIGLGGHQAGIAARRVTGDIAYVTGLDPSMLGWINHSDRFQATDGLYTEVIHTNAGANGYIGELAQVDFYPNGGESMPGCDSNTCSHDRSYFYFAESIVSGGFNSNLCATLAGALLGNCILPLRLPMGGLRPKIGNTGIYGLQTNAFPPFSQD